MSGKHKHGRLHKPKGLGPTLSRRERVAALQRQLDEQGRIDEVAVNSHKMAIAVSRRSDSESILPGTGGLTRRQLSECARHGSEVMRMREAQERARSRMTIKELLREG